MYKGSFPYTVSPTYNMLYRYRTLITCYSNIVRNNNVKRALIINNQ